MTTTVIIPSELRERRQWVAWNMEARKTGGKPTKVPKNPNTGGNAMADKPETWGSFDAAVKMAEQRGWSGVGFEFSADDQYAGVDLDNCRNRETGEIQPWAKTIIGTLSSYAEISPSGYGLKMWVRGKLSNGSIAKHTLPADKYPSTHPTDPAGFEAYDRGRHDAALDRRRTDDARRVGRMVAAIVEISGRRLRRKMGDVHG